MRRRFWNCDPWPAALFGVPTIVCYKLSLLTEFIASFVLKYEGPVSLGNIAHQKKLFPELVQHHADRYNISKHLKNWLEDPQRPMMKYQTSFPRPRHFLRGRIFRFLNTWRR